MLSQLETVIEGAGFIWEGEQERIFSNLRIFLLTDYLRSYPAEKYPIQSFKIQSYWFPSEPGNSDGDVIVLYNRADQTLTDMDFSPVAGHGTTYSKVTDEKLFMIREKAMKRKPEKGVWANDFDKLKELDCPVTSF